MITHAITIEDEFDWNNLHPLAIRFDSVDWWVMQDQDTADILVPIGVYFPPARVILQPNMGYALQLALLGADVEIYK